MGAKVETEVLSAELSPLVRRVALALIALAFFAVRWRWFGVPFERDEGEYAYGGQLLLDGVPPYVGIYNMKLPGIYAIYALLLASGGSAVRAVHAGLAAADVASFIALYVLARRLFDAATGIACAAVLAVLFLLPSVQASSANAEHFVLPFALWGLATLARVHDGRSGLGGRQLLLAGMLLGLAVLVKQHGALLAAAGVMTVALQRAPGADAPGRWSGSALVSLGIVLPYALTVALYAAGGHLSDFWHWTVSYAMRYTQEAPISMGLERLAKRSGALFMDAPLILSAATLGLVLLVANARLRRHWRFIAPVVLGSAAAITPGFYFRPHYFVLLLPAAALLAVAGVRVLTGPRQRVFMGTALALVAGVPLLHSEWLFALSPTEVSRRLYGDNPFPESLVVGDYLAQHAAPDDRLLVLGSEPQIYVYSGLRGATGFVYTYALMEQHEFARSMQEQLIRETEEVEPRWMVMVRHPQSWVRRAESDPLIFRWSERSLADFDLVARMPLGSGRSRLVEGAELAGMGNPDALGLDIYRRRE
ncbi:MAG: hypothetical protein ACI8QZ_002736 [Chlamydiales bacterium]|jgi:hypothetical protein